MKPATLPRRALATVLAVCAHLLVLLLLGWRIPRTAAPPPSEDHAVAIEAILVRPEVRRQVGARTPSPAPSAPRALARVLIAPMPDAPSLGAPVQSPSPQAEADADAQSLRNALRGLTGCSDPAAAGLSREERSACDRRLAAAKPAPVGNLPSAEELAQFNADRPQDSILVRKLRNGCLPRLGDRPGAVVGAPRPTRRGDSTTYGVGCAFSF